MTRGATASLRTLSLAMGFAAGYALVVTLALGDVLPPGRFGYLTGLWVFGVVASILTGLRYREGPFLFLIVLIGIAFEKWFLSTGDQIDRLNFSWGGAVLFIFVAGSLFAYWDEMRSLTSKGAP